MTNYTLSATSKTVTVIPQYADVARGVSFRDPVSGEMFIKNFAPATHSYTSADDAYNTWCAGASLDPLVSDFTFNTSYGYSNGSFLTPPVKLIDGAVYNSLFFGGSGQVMIYRRQPADFASPNFGIVGASPGFGVSPEYMCYRSVPIYYPLFTLGLELSNLDGSSYICTNVLARYDTTNGEMFLIFTRKVNGSPAYPVRMAIRLRGKDGYIETVISQDSADIRGSYRNWLMAVVCNEITSVEYQSWRLANDIRGVVCFKSTAFTAKERDTCAEGVGVTGAGLTQFTYSTPVSELLYAKEGYKFGWPKTLAAGVGVTAALTADNRFAKEAAEKIGVTSALTVAGIFGMTAAEAPAVAAALKVAIPVICAAGIGMTEGLALVRSVLVAERIGLLGEASANGRYGLTATEAMRVVDSLTRFIGAEANEAMGVTGALTVNARLAATAADAAGIADAAAPYFMLSAIAAEEIGVDDASILNMIFNGVVDEGIGIRVGYLEPSGSFTTFAVNTRSGAISEYTNFAFNSFARMGRKYLAASETGIYELLGDDDAGTPIIAKMRGGYSQFVHSRLSSLECAYLGIRGDGDFYFRVVTENGTTTYRVKSTSMKTTKVRVGKGLRARYWAFELESTGQAFDLESVEFIPIVAKRRV